MIDAIRAARSAIEAGRTRMDVAASNIARSAVPGSKPLRVGQVTAPVSQGGGVQAHVRPDDDADGVDLSEQAIELLRAEKQVESGAAVLRRLDEAQDALLDAIDRD